MTRKERGHVHNQNADLFALGLFALGPVALVPIALSRIVASPETVQQAISPNDLRLSADEALCFADADSVVARLSPDQVAAAIVEPDVGWSGAWASPSDLKALLVRVCEWGPQVSGGLSQGLIAGVPAKVWFPADPSSGASALLLVPTAFAGDLAERLS
jgi:hypothetical protein